MISIKRTPNVKTNGSAIQNNEGITINKTPVAATATTNPTPYIVFDFLFSASPIVFIFCAR